MAAAMGLQPVARRRLSMSRVARGIYHRGGCDGGCSLFPHSGLRAAELSAPGSIYIISI